MDGIILFADDQVFDTKSNEYQLFCKFKSDSKLSVLPVESIDVLERTLSSISTYRAIILDWNFKRTLDSNDDTNIPDETPYDILRKFPLYSLIYVYSQNVISDTIKDELNKKFCGKIFFEQKSNSQNLDFEYNKIINGIKQFENNNKHMQVPFTWSQAINESVQKIFRELELADSNWIKEIYDTAKNDGAEPSIEVISVFNNLLNESIIQNKELTNKLLNYTQGSNAVAQEGNTLAKLYNRIYYTKLLKETPFTTGDIFNFGNGEYGILLTPECDINAKKEKALEFLLLNKEQIRDKTHKKNNEGKPTEELKKIDTSLFNNRDIGCHILPSFPFEKDKYDEIAYIDFKDAFMTKTKNEYEKKRTEFKLNSPYIYQLRQRYLAYIGRVGVPAIPESLRRFNWK